jgi:hypothetical protein
MALPHRLRIERLLAAVALLAATCGGTEMSQAPNGGARPANQLEISGNACGPAALLSSFRCGNPAWQKAAAALPGENDRARLRHWIRHHGLRPSETLKGRTRWTAAGINVEDLVTAANEMSRPLYLPMIGHDGLYLRGRETPGKLLRRSRERLQGSLEKGIPPILSLRRQVLRNGQWISVQGHFVTVIAVPRKLGRGDTGFPITYLDPWGGKRCEGWIRIPEQALLVKQGGISPCLLAEVPAANIGKKAVRRGETTVVIPETVIGRW